MGRRQTAAAVVAPAAATSPVYRPVPHELVVAFIRDHRHAGKQYSEGATLTCTQETARLLRQFGAIGEG